MVVSDLDRLAQSVRRALDRIDTLEAEKRRLATDNSILDARLKKGQAGGGPRATAASESQLPEVRVRIEKLIARLREYEEALVISLRPQNRG